LKAEVFFQVLKEQGVEFYTGVPDSTLKHFCFFMDSQTTQTSHIIAANEGNAIGIATGYYLSTGKVPLVYMQNSGFGNALNPITSLIDETVFSVPMIIMMGWRGEPGVKDAIQHKKDGDVQEDILKSLNLPYTHISNDLVKMKNQMEGIFDSVKNNNEPHVILVSKNYFQKFNSKNVAITQTNFLTREMALTNIINNIEDEDVVVSTTGKCSRELYEIRKKLSMNPDRDLRIVGSMGHVSSVALGISINISNQIFCIDGDGSLIMHMGTLPIIGKYSNNNFKHIILNNFSHDSVGGQESSSNFINYEKLAKSTSYKKYFQIDNRTSFVDTFNSFRESEGPSLLEILISKGSRENLTRPKTTPLENRLYFMNFLNKINR